MFGVKTTSDVINSFFTLPSLTLLNIDSAVTDVVEIICKKPLRLKSLIIINTKFDNLDFLNYCSELDTLRLEGLGLIQHPQPLPKSLTSLSIARNNIVNLDKSIIDQFPTIESNFQHIQHFHKMEVDAGTINLSQNPIENPPLELLLGPRDNLNSYFSSMQGDTTILNEAKIIFVGDGAVGKTSLMKRLVSDAFDACESQTDGIEIEPYKVEVEDGNIVNSTIWDFGGQQILQATHQLFLSKRSIYVLVVEDRKNDQHKDQDIEQWLTQINSLGGKPQILVVKNKIDENPHSDIQTQKLKRKFSNIVGFYEISCQTREGMDKFDRALTDCVKHLPMRQIKLPNNWLSVKKDLKKQAKQSDLLYLNTYRDLCKANNIHDKIAKDTLLKLLHDLGEVIAFEELKSHNTAILNPEWITEGIYAIIRSESLSSNNGVLTLDEAQHALDSYSDHNRFEDKAAYILDAMCNFDLCHLTEETQTYLIPALLPPQVQLDEWNNIVNINFNKIIRFIFKFENLLPAALLPMLIVKMHAHVKGENRWRTGAIIAPSRMNAQALVETDKVSKEISLLIIGEERRDLLILLRNEINSLTRRLADVDEIGLSEHVVLDDSDERKSYDELIGLKRMRVANFPVGKLGRSFSVSEVLGEIEPIANTEQAIKFLFEEGPENGLININMSQNNQNTATGGNANNTNTVNTTVEQTADATSTATSTAEIKLELKDFKGQADFVLEDIEEQIEDLTSSDRQIKGYAERECSKVKNAIAEIESNVTDNASAQENLKHFSRVKHFLEGTLNKANSVGKIIENTGDIYNQVEQLAHKFNHIAGKFSMPLITLGLL